MSAPLYSRFRRKASDQLKRYDISPGPKRLMTQAKNRCRVYSFSNNASRALGQLSATEPKSLKEMFVNRLLPSQHVWFEYSWEDTLDGLTEEGILCPEYSDKHPLKMGWLVMTDQTDDPIIFAVPYYVYATGLSMFGPIMVVLDDMPEDPRAYWEDSYEFLKSRQMPMDQMALGPAWAGKWTNVNPRVQDWLSKRVRLTMFGIDRNVDRKNRKDFVVEALINTNGAGRLVLAGLAMIAGAKSPTKHLTTRDVRLGFRPKDHPEGHNMTEVDLFLKDPQTNIKHLMSRSRRTVTGMKKGLHEVAAHWAYRSRKDGGDPRVCRAASHHDWEDVEGTRTQVCVFCDQKRWRKDAHERGDAAYGIVPKKTYNVRVGG